MFCFRLVLQAVEELVEQRELYVSSQRRVGEAKSEINALKEQIAQLQLQLMAR